MPSSAIGQGFNDLQQGLEDMNKARDEAKKAEAQSAGNRQIYNQLVNSGIWGNQEVIDFNKKDAKGRNEMIAAGVRAQLFKSQAEDQQMQRDAAERAKQQLQITKHEAAARAADRQAELNFKLPDTAKPIADPRDPNKAAALAFEIAPHKVVTYAAGETAAEKVAREAAEAKIKQGRVMAMVDQYTREGFYKTPQGREFFPGAEGAPVLVPQEREARQMNELEQEQWRVKHPTEDIELKLGLTPYQIFKGHHEAGSQTRDGWVPAKKGEEAQAPNIRIDGVVIPRGTHETYKRRLTDELGAVGIRELTGPATAAPATPPPYSLFRQPISTSMPAWQRQTGGTAAPSPTPDATPAPGIRTISGGAQPAATPPTRVIPGPGGHHYEVDDATKSVVRQID